jgi:hypothetical protein
VPVCRQHQTEIANSMAAFSSGGEKLFHLVIGEKVFLVLVNRFAGSGRYFYHSLHYESQRVIFEIVFASIFLILRLLIS